MNSNCPGIPEQCDHAKRVFDDALNGMVPAPKLAELRAEISHCAPCVANLDLEVGFRNVMSQASRQEAPAHLQARISTALGRIDLNEIDVTDL